MWWSKKKSARFTDDQIVEAFGERELWGFTLSREEKIEITRLLIDHPEEVKDIRLALSLYRVADAYHQMGKNLAFIGPDNNIWKPGNKNGWELSLSVAGNVLPKGLSEEWIGDFREALQKLRDEGYPRWQRCAIAIGKLALLIIAALKIRLTDFRR